MQNEAVAEVKQQRVLSDNEKNAVSVIEISHTLFSVLLLQKKQTIKTYSRC